MEGKLFEAACTGDLNALYESVREDGAILQKLHSRRCANTPLHLASTYGHADFVGKYIIWSSISTQQLCQLNQDGYSPMHLASTNGHAEIVRILLEFGNKNFAVEDLCLKKDRDGGTALHSAVATGNLDVIKMLFAACPKAAKEVTFDDESVLHIAVKQYQFEALKLLMEKLGSEEETLLNLRDLEGNTVLDLATARRKHQNIVKHLLELLHEDVNMENSNGLAPDTICAVNSNDLHVEEATDVTGGSQSPKMEIIKIEATNSMSNHNKSNNIHIPEASSQDENKNGEMELNDVRNGIIVMASILMTLTFQVALTPPGGEWQDSGPNAGKSILYESNHWKYGVILFCNMNAFIFSIFIIFIALHPSKFGFGLRTGVALTYAVNFTMGLLLAEFFSILFLTMDKMYRQAAFIVTAVFWCTFIAFLSFLLYVIRRLLKELVVGWRDAMAFLLALFVTKPSPTLKGRGSDGGNKNTNTRTHQEDSFGGESHTTQSTSRACS